MYTVKNKSRQQKLETEKAADNSEDTPGTRSWDVSESEPYMLVAVHLYWPPSFNVGLRIWSRPKSSQDTLKTGKRGVRAFIPVGFFQNTQQSFEKP